MKPKFLFFAVLFSLIAVNGSAAEPARRNIVLMLADDLGWTDLGCYGSSFYESPRIDRLAAEGMRFTQAYTAGSVCSPTRSSIMTGRYPVRTGVTDYIPGLHPAGVKLETPQTRMELGRDELTIAEALGKGGYQTFYSGKWHLGGAGSGPGEHGFEVVVEDHELGSHGQDPLVGDRLTDSALKFLDQHDRSRPFFMFLGYHEPHTPILAHPAHIERFQKKAAAFTRPAEMSKMERNGQSRLVQDDPAYATEVTVLDEGVRRISDKLEVLGITQETVFIFFSDNGGLCTKAQPGPTANLPLRSGKGWLYEGGIRVPLIIRAPGLVAPGSVCESPVISTDLFPTVLKLAALPSLPDKHLDGRSMVPLLSGKSPSHSRTLYWHYPHYHGSTWAPGSALRDGDWKLIQFFDEDKVELYNLRDDLGEQHDLAEREAARAQQLLAQLDAWQQATHAVIPTPAPEGGTKPVAKPKRGKKKK